MIELNAGNFEAEVIRKSQHMPVLVDFWADWCAPCKMLVPVLAKLAVDYADRLHITKVNTDRERDLARQYGIRSLPTLHLYSNGRLVEEVLGAQPESTLRALIENYLVRKSDDALHKALASAEAGDLAQALQTLEQALAEDPQNPRLPLELARLYLEDEQFDKAAGLLESQPRELRESDQGKSLQLMLEFAAASAGNPDTGSLTSQLEENPANSEARFRLASSQLTAGDYDAALENFLELLKRERNYGDGAAQRGLLAVFSLLGENDERVGSYRRKMFNLLH
jgi:putative thioredoxin